MNSYSPFTVGAKVAFIASSNWGRRISPRVVGKVRKDGKFFLLNNSDGQVGDAMFTPDKYSYADGTWGADRSGRNEGWRRDRVELWTEKHDQEIACEEKRRAVNRAVGAFEDFLRMRKTGAGDYHLTDRQLELMEDIIRLGKRSSEEQAA